MEKTKFLTLVTFLLFCFASVSEIRPQVQNLPPKSLVLDVDLSRFVGQSGLTRVEVYQSIGRGGLTYADDSNYAIAHFSVETVILKSDSTIFSHKITEADSVQGKTEIKSGQQFVYTVPLFLPPGDYEVLTRLQEPVAGRDEEKRLPIHVTSFSVDSLTFSDIQFASKIEKARGQHDMHVKNNLRIIPNPTALFGEGKKKLSFYAELYNLADTETGQGTYRVDYVIETQDGEVLHTITGKKRKKAGRNSAIFTSFDISDLATAIYRLRLVAHDDQTGLEAATEKEFYVIWEKDLISQTAETQPHPYSTLDEKTLDNYFAKLAYIATRDEKRIFHELDQTGKQSFLSDFWAKRDPTPATAVNEFKDAYVKRVIQANTHFSSLNLEGWRTDRGRILMTYGAPDFIDREPESKDKKAFEIWHYNDLEGGAIFVFVDLKSTELFELIHSTYRKELSRPNWESYLDQ